MSTKLENAKKVGKVYYGLHMYPGVAEYAEKGKEAKRVFIGEEAVKNMNSTFPGKPVFVHHVPDVDPDNLQEDGWVSDSFYNPIDGKNWVKFVVHSEKAHEAISKGWKLSNAYFARETSAGGLASGVEYQQEVVKGEYEHLAIVPNPRYEESVILTPEQFKEYNRKKEIELSKLTNSKDQPKGDSSMLKIFKRTKVENSADFDEMSVKLPESGKEVTLAEAVAIADKFTNMQGYASDDHMVKCNDDEEMSVKDLKKNYNKMKNDEKERAEKEKAAAEAVENDDEDGDDEGEAGASGQEKGMGKLKKNKKENAIKIEEARKAKDEAAKAAFDADKFFNEINGAEGAMKPVTNEDDVEMAQTKVQRGKSRYGSN